MTSQENYPIATHPTFRTVEVISTNAKKGTALIRYTSRMALRRFRRSVLLADLTYATNEGVAS